MPKLICVVQCRCTVYFLAPAIADSMKARLVTHKDADAQARFRWESEPWNLDTWSDVLVLHSSQTKIVNLHQAVEGVHEGHPGLQLPGGRHPLHQSEEEEGGGEGERGGLQGL